MSDARFQDGDEGPLRLSAMDPADLSVISALVQDSVLSGNDMIYRARALRFAALINRFRWEDKTAAEAAGRPYERVRAMLDIGGVLKVRTSGITPGDADQVLSLLAIEFEEQDDGAGVLRLVLAGDGAIEIEVECLELTLTDVSRPYAAPSGHAPSHD